MNDLYDSKNTTLYPETVQKTSIIQTFLNKFKGKKKPVGPIIESNVDKMNIFSPSYSSRTLQ